MKRIDRLAARRDAYSTISKLLDGHTELEGQPMDEHGCDGCEMCTEIRVVIEREAKRARHAAELASALLRGGR